MKRLKSEKRNGNENGKLIVTIPKLQIADVTGATNSPSSQTDPFGKEPSKSAFGCISACFLVKPIPKGRRVHPASRPFLFWTSPLPLWHSTFLKFLKCPKSLKNFPFSASTSILFSSHFTSFPLHRIRQRNCPARHRNHRFETQWTGSERGTVESRPASANCSFSISRQLWAASRLLIQCDLKSSPWKAERKRTGSRPTPSFSKAVDCVSSLSRRDGALIPFYAVSDPSFVCLASALFALLLSLPPSLPFWPDVQPSTLCVLPPSLARHT